MEPIQIHFTKSRSPLSWLIRKVTKEPVSHCAIQYKEWIIHSNLLGVRALPANKFSNQIQYSVPAEVSLNGLVEALVAHGRASYDFGAILFLFLRLIFPRFVPKKNLWQSSGMFMCTEWVTQVLGGEADSMITCMKLYKKLSDKQASLPTA